MNEKKNFIWNFLGLTVNSFNSLFYLIIINRVNNTTEAGIFTFAFSLITLFYFIGTYYNRAYQISNDKYNNKEFIINRIISCFIMLFICIAYCILMKYELHKLTIIILICIFRLLEAFADVFYGIVHKKGELYKAGKSMFFKSLIGLIGFIILDLMFKNVVIAILQLIIINLIGIIFYDYRNSNKYVEKDFKVSNVFDIYKKTLPIFVFTFLSMYLVNASKYTLDHYSTADIQNVFGIILMPGTIISLFSSYIINPYISKLDNLYKNKKIRDFKNTIKNISLVILLFGIIAEIAAFILGIPVLNILYGLKLDAYKYELMIVICGAVFLAFISVLSSAYTIMGYNYIQMYIYIVNSVIAFILSRILVVKYNIFGASLEYMIIMILQFIAYFCFYEYYCVKIKTRRN